MVERYWAMGPEENTKHAPIISNLLTEELIKSEIARYLPPYLDISKGEVVKEREISGDCDLIIFKRPPIFQYGSIAIVPFENVKAIIDVEVHGENFLKSMFQEKSKRSKKVLKKIKAWKTLKSFTKELLYVGLHAHKNSPVFPKWRKATNERNLPIFIFYLKPSRQIIEGAFQRLITKIQELK